MKLTASLATLAALSLSAAGAVAQSDVPPEQQAPPPSATAPQDTPQNSQSAAQVSDEQIEQFAAAFAEIQTIQSDATRELESTTDEAAADKVVSDAETQMIAAVERSGLRIDEFNRIAELMTTDTSVRARVAEKLQKRGGGG